MRPRRAYRAYVLAHLRPRRLVGRDNEIRDVAESIASAPVTTLTGPGGVDKTALAMAVAAACTGDFPDGVTVVWLGSLRSVELVATEVATQLGLPRSGGQSYEDALTHWLTERDVLLVIDNCEHVLSAVADLVAVLRANNCLAVHRQPCSGTTSRRKRCRVQPPPPLSEVLSEPVDRELEAAVLACLRKDPSARPSNANAMIALSNRSKLAHQWTQADATAWWMEHGPVLKHALVSTETESSKRSIMISTRG